LQRCWQIISCADFLAFCPDQPPLSDFLAGTARDSRTDSLAGSRRRRHALFEHFGFYLHAQKEQSAQGFVRRVSRRGAMRRVDAGLNRGGGGEINATDCRIVGNFVVNAGEFVTVIFKAAHCGRATAFLQGGLDKNATSIIIFTATG
jgi:hypothetical protein